MINLNKRPKNISIIVAKTLNNVIGLDNKMPWHLPADLKWFKANTLAKPIIMGRRTFESIGKPLPKRQNIVLSRTNFSFPEVLVFVDLIDAFKHTSNEDEVMIIGGANLYKQTLDYANKLYLTEIQTQLTGDSFFPELDNSWELTSEQTYLADENNQYDLKFKILQRK